MRTRNNPSGTADIVTAGLLAAAAVVLHIFEGMLPPVSAIPGVKLGVANSVTVFAAYYLNFGFAAAIQIVRILLGALLSGQMLSAMYSLAGGIFALAVIGLLRLKPGQMWAVSAFSAIANSLGQIAVAYFVMRSGGVFAYLPHMIIASIICGTLTGLCARGAYIKLRRIKNGKR